jgi:sugar (pentulose or hexulose) kinase
MRETNTQHYVGVDIGTSAVRVVVGTVDEQGRPEIIGFSQAENTGMRRGVVAHVDADESYLNAPNVLGSLSFLGVHHVRSRNLKLAPGV